MSLNPINYYNPIIDPPDQKSCICPYMKRYIAAVRYQKHKLQTLLKFVVSVCVWILVAWI
jgi:uncharacterized membrane protein (GlpM family)